MIVNALGTTSTRIKLKYAIMINREVDRKIAAISVTEDVGPSSFFCTDEAIHLIEDSLDLHLFHNYRTEFLTSFTMKFEHL